MKSIEIPNSVTAIGNYAFSNCVRLKSVEIPSSVTTMGSDAFMGCIDLISIKIPSSVTSIGQNAFIQCNSVLTIYGTSGSYAEQYANENKITFKDLTNLPPVEESGDFIIDENGVLGKYNGKGGDVVIPDGVTAIGDYAFSACVNMTSIEIPNSVTKIGRSAFLSCIKLTSIEIPDSVTSIEECVFGACRGLKNIKVDEGNPAYDSRNNCNAIIETASNTLVAGCGNTVIPGSIAAIGAYAFYSCETLADIEIPNSVAVIGNYAFDGCSSLTGIEIPNRVTSIGRHVFDDCSSLASITVSKGNTVYDSRNNCNAIIETASNTLIAGFQNTIIPNGVTTIGSWAFYGRSSLTSIEIPNSVTAIGKDAFSKCNSGLIIYGRSGSYAEEYAKEQHIVFESLGSVESISQAAITLEKDSYIYDGTAKTPAVVVELNGKTLVLDTDYTISYSNNINAGTAKVTVTGRDNYIGSKSVNFTIAKAGGQTDSKDSKITCKKTVYRVAYGKKPFKINAASKSRMTFTSSKPKIVAVDKNTGRVTIKNTGVATITIKAGKTSKKVAIKVSPKKPSLKSAKAVKGRKLVLKWAKDKRASGYQIQISTNKKFKKGVKSKKLSKTSYTFTKLKTGKKYYVRLRSYKKSGKETLYSAWSKAKSSSKIKR